MLSMKYPMPVLFGLFISTLIIPTLLIEAGAQELECLRGSREVTISPWGGIDVKDSFRLRNTGNITYYKATVQLPKDAGNVAAFDGVSSISTSILDRNNTKLVDVTFRYPLRGKVGNTVYNDIYTFSVSYKLDSASRVKQLSFDKFMAMISVATGIDMAVSNWTVSVTLPEGASFSSSTPYGTVTVNGLLTVVTFEFGEMGTSDSQITLEYSYFPLWSLYRPAQWLGFSSLIIGIVILARRLKPRGIAKKRNTELIKSLADLLEEELSLLKEEEQLEKALASRSLGKKDYNRRRRIIEQRLRNLSASITAAKKRLESETTLTQLLDRVEDAEHDIEKIRIEIRKLREQQRIGKVAKGELERFEQDSRRRMSKAIGVLEDATARLREEGK